MNKTKFLQTDSKWGNLVYPKAPCYIRNCGCGEVSIANIIIEMDKYKKYTPATIQPYCKQFAASNCDGTYWSGIPKMMKHYGLTEVKEHATMASLWKELAKGDRVAIYLMGSRLGGSKKIRWTNGGHFVASVDYKYENKLHKVYVKDPWTNNKNRNGWISYEENMKNDVVKVWSGKLVANKKAEDKPKTYKVIDVSDWQGQIDWAKVKADGVVGAIIRYADGTTLDKRFQENMLNAKKAGLHIGSYIFSRAKTKAEAEKEAERIFEAVRGYEIDMPLYIDLEVSSLSKYANTVAQAFINKIKALGGKPGVYANLNWWNNYLTKTVELPFAMWLAQYNDTMDYKPSSYVGMWQYSSSGSVNGISGKVDMDTLYIPYWETAPKIPKKTVDELAKEVLDDKWGSGDARKENLTKAGYDYDAVQKRVNELVTEANRKRIADVASSFCGSKTAATPKYEEAAKAVYGSGNDTNCHRFVGTVLKNCGYGKMTLKWASILKFLKENFEELTVDYTAEQLIPGDIRVRRKGTAYHIWIIEPDGKKAESAHDKTYPHIATNNATTKYTEDWLFRAK